MNRLVPCVVAVLFAGAASAQTPLRWPAPGGTLSYKVAYSTQQTHTLNDTTSVARSVVKVTRQWKVVAVDPAGTATLSMSLAAMVQERTTTTGGEWKFDSADPKSGTPEMREAMLKHLNTPLATVQVDGFGRVLGVKDSKSDATSFENELPFLGVLPAGEVKPGMAWQREFKVTMAPPLGTGEKYDAVQRFVCRSVTDGKAVVAVTTELKDRPKAAADLIPLWQMLPKGELTWDLKLGRLDGGRLTVEEKLDAVEGAGSSTAFTSIKTIELDR
ncbi:MAG: hypothetical protein ACRC33_07645 [Gemmataceae bacterium]